MAGEPLLFALEASRPLGQAIARELGAPLAQHEEREFDGGEHKSRPLMSVRGRDVYVLHSLYGEARQSANDKLCRLLFFLGALRDAAAGRITALVPYLPYSRKDRKTKSRDPVTTRYVAALFEAVGVDCVVTIDVHNLSAFQNAFRCRSEHLEARCLFAGHFIRRLEDRDLVAVSPDAGGEKRADAFRRTLAARSGRAVPLAFMEKRRSEGEVSGDTLVGEVEGRSAILLDDLIASGTTLIRAAGACRRAGAKEVHAVATHGTFSAEATRLAEAGFASIVVTDSVAGLAPSALARQLTVLSIAPLFAEAIRRMHGDGSLVELCEQD